ncbi:pyruvate ferredoxin oxidoreductase subunit gamma [Candidatus Micrarchaeota archaeon]|jgi:2-oxoacid:acceptor oxidoreductase gamma subunit (pyruvate/2-ketoisovalerate family)|nr:pyruvate ferredoxin oxidoreductase subunit gamma [Candidatus Micrarchaeota archaeon]
MIEVRFHGRGGQGAVTAAELLAVAVGHYGKYSKSFPFFGVERRGAPVQAFCRIDDKPIRIHQNVVSPNIVVVLDATLMDNVDVTEGLENKGLIIINTSKESKEFLLGDYKIVTVDATNIAYKNLSVPIVNTAILGVFEKLVDWVNVDSLEKAINERFDEKLALKNINAMKQCANEVRI